MANQIDNITLNDDTTGFIRTVDVASDDLFISVDLTLQSGAVFESDNIKRGSGDPNGVVSGNEGDLYIRTDVSLGSVWVNTDGTNTGWEQSVTSSTGTLGLSQVLTNGNFTGGTDIEITNGDSIVGEDPGGAITITAGSNTASGGNGGVVTITAGAGGVLGLAGDLVLATQGLPAEPGDIQLNSSGAVLINPATDSTAQVTGSSVLQFEERASLVGPPVITAGQGRIWVRDDTPNVLMFTDDAATDWVINGPGSAQGWSDVLAAGNTSGGTDAEISSGDAIVGEGNASGDGGDVPITAGSSTGGNGDGGDVVLTPGSGNGTGADGIVQVNGPKHYANSSTDPTDPAPAEGDRYYNTALEMDMRYDGSRSKWLSVESGTIWGSDTGALTDGTYLEVGARRMDDDEGFTAHFNGTVVSLGWTRTDSDSSSFEVTEGGTTVATASTSATSGQNTTLNGDFSQGGILGIRNGGPNTMSNTTVWVRVKWRA